MRDVRFQLSLRKIEDLLHERGIVSLARAVGAVGAVGAIWLQTMVPLTAVDTVELQGCFRVANSYVAIGHISFWGCKAG